MSKGVKRERVYKATFFYHKSDEHGDIYISTSAPNKFMRKYKLNETTYPVIGTKLFAFRDLSDAAAYLGIHTAIFECEATGVIGGCDMGRSDWLYNQLWLDSLVSDLSELRTVFKTRGYSDAWKSTPYKSVVLCTSIKPIRLLSRDEVLNVIERLP